MERLKHIYAIAKIDLISTVRNGSSVFFGLLFPLIFIFIFGSLGGGAQEYSIGVLEGSATDNQIFEALQKIEAFQFETELSDDEIMDQLSRGSLEGAISIEETITNGVPNYNIGIVRSNVDQQEGQIIESIIRGFADRFNLTLAGIEQPPISVSSEEIEGREFKQIDYILPGQLGFALLSSGIFSTAFLIVSLKETLVLKRFFATPIKGSSILIGFAMSKLLFALLQAVVIIVAGVLLFDYTLVNGFETFVQILIMSTIALFVFLGFGLVVSSISKDQNSIAPIANLITLPQFLLAGTFFPIEVFPEWLQPISRILPLTYLNDALREIAFDGASLLSQGPEIAALAVWGVIVYALTSRLFSWE